MPDNLDQWIHELGQTGARLLAVAMGAHRDQLTLVGLVALQDPPRDDSAQLIAGLHRLGIQVVMITGDNADTAQYIAQQVGISGMLAPQGEINNMTPQQALDFAIHAQFFPQDKIALVRLLQQGGHEVGMTGDGVNDAPALRQADVGIAVSGAIDVARASAGVVLTAPGLPDVLNAVIISRRIYQRMLTYTINKIMKTLEISLFLTIGVILIKAFIITPLLVMLLLFTNDFVTMSIATDYVGYVKSIERWNVRHLMLTGGMMAGFILLLFFTLFFGEKLFRSAITTITNIGFCDVGGYRAG